MKKKQFRNIITATEYAPSGEINRNNSINNSTLIDLKITTEDDYDVETAIKRFNKEKTSQVDWLQLTKSKNSITTQHPFTDIKCILEEYERLYSIIGEQNIEHICININVDVKNTSEFNSKFNALWQSPYGKIISTFLNVGFTKEEITKQSFFDIFL